MFDEFFTKVTSLSPGELWADTHGGLAMVTLVLFGAALLLYFSYDKFKAGLTWFKVVLGTLAGSLTLINIVGLLIYIPYRAGVSSSPKSLLLASENTAWLHEIVFEHKEFLAFAPAVLLLTAFFVVLSRGGELSKRPYLKKAVLFSIVAGLVLVLVVAAEAVLITKAAPLK